MAKIVWTLPETALLLFEWILYVFQAPFYIFPLHPSHVMYLYLGSAVTACGVDVSKHFHQYFCAQV